MAGRIASLIGRAVLPRRRHGFLRDEKGATIIEFGFLAIPFFGILGAILETSVVFLSGQILDSAVQEVSRQLRTGQAQAANVTAAQFKTRVCDRLYGLFRDCDALHVEVQPLNDFTTASITPPVDWSCRKDEANDCDWTRGETYLPGQGSDIMVVQVYYKWPVILTFGAVSLANLPDGNRLLGAVSVFRNEPFS